jgi:hypothetical protein
MADISSIEDEEQDPIDEEWRLDEAHGFLNELAGSTEAEMWMHAVARAALLNLLVSDPTVDQLFWRWMHMTRFGRAVYELVEQFGRCAEAFGMGNAYEFTRFRKNTPADGMITIQAADASEADRISDSLSASVAEVDRLLDELIESSNDLDPTQLADEAVILVRDEWKLPWPWLANELIHAWFLIMHNCAFGARSTINYWIESDELQRPAPAIDFHFMTKPAETISDSYQRFLNELSQRVIVPFQVAAAPLPRGRVTDELVAARYVEWWYRKNILRESIRSIADKDDGKRSLVRYGIRQAKRWLSVANCAWKEQDAA